MNISIINIGDELLIGQIINTNASWLAKELNQLGGRINNIQAIADHADDIISSLDKQLQSSEIIIITGGLGPTKDDITKKTLATYFQSEMTFHEASFENIERLLIQFGKKADDRYRLQALMPNNAEILINLMGTASGMLFQKNGKLIFSLPGVPREMEYLMREKVIPILMQKYAISIPTQKHYILFGIGETDLSEKLDSFENKFVQDFSLAYLPETQNGYLKLRLNQKNSITNQSIDEVGEELEQLIQPFLISKQGQRIEEVLLEKLKKKNKTVATAESCTGGQISQKITSIPGSSQVFIGTVVSYHNDIKKKILKVAPDTLDQFGAVSEQTVVEMSQNISQIFQTNCSIATSGIAGPTGGNDKKPVGMICIAAHYDGITRTQTLYLGNNRKRFVEIASNYAMLLLIQLLDTID